MKLLEVTVIYQTKERIYTRKTTLNLDRFILVHEDFLRPKERSYIYYDSGEGEGGFVVDETYESLIKRIEFLSNSNSIILFRDNFKDMFQHKKNDKDLKKLFKAPSEEGKTDV